MVNMISKLAGTVLSMFALGKSTVCNNKWSSTSTLSKNGDLFMNEYWSCGESDDYFKVFFDLPDVTNKEIAFNRDSEELQHLQSIKSVIDYGNKMCSENFPGTQAGKILEWSIYALMGQNIDWDTALREHCQDDVYSKEFYDAGCRLSNSTCSIPMEDECLNTVGLNVRYEDHECAGIFESVETRDKFLNGRKESNPARFDKNHLCVYDTFFRCYNPNDLTALGLENSDHFQSLIVAGLKINGYQVYQWPKAILNLSSAKNGVKFTQRRLLNSARRRLIDDNDGQCVYFAYDSDLDVEDGLRSPHLELTPQIAPFIQFWNATNDMTPDYISDVTATADYLEGFAVAGDATRPAISVQLVTGTLHSLLGVELVAIPNDGPDLSIFPNSWAFAYFCKDENSYTMLDAESFSASANLIITPAPTAAPVAP